MNPWPPGPTTGSFPAAPFDHSQVELPPEQITQRVGAGVLVGLQSVLARSLDLAGDDPPIRTDRDDIRDTSEVSPPVIDPCQNPDCLNGVFKAVRHPVNDPGNTDEVLIDQLGLPATSPYLHEHRVIGPFSLQFTRHQGTHRHHAPRMVPNIMFSLLVGRWRVKPTLTGLETVGLAIGLRGCAGPVPVQNRNTSTAESCGHAQNHSLNSRPTHGQPFHFFRISLWSWLIIATSPYCEITMPESHPDLFHYTSLQACEGILQSDNLWASRGRHLNDSSEFELMWSKIPPLLSQFIQETIQADPDYHRKYQGTIDSLGGIERIAAQDADAFVRIMRSLIFEYAPPFIACFTTHDEDYDGRNGLLSQWRGYGDDGVAIVFDYKKLDNQLKDEKARFHSLEYTLVKVIYDTDDLDLREQFPDLYATLKNEVVPAYLAGLPKNNQTEKALSNAAIELFRAVGKLKHWGFREEKEHRIIVGVANPARFDGVNASLSASQNLKTINFRPGRCGSIPYIKLFEEDKHLPISRILVGPSRNQDANAFKVETILKHMALQHKIELETSAIPYVSTT